MANRRSATSAISKRIAECSQPVYVVDHRRQVCFVNAAFTDWLGLDESDLDGVVCNYHSRSDAQLIQRIAAALCPPPECFQGAARTSIISEQLASLCKELRKDSTEHAAQREVESAPRRAVFTPLASESGDDYWILAVVDAELPATATLAESAEDPELCHQQLGRLRRDYAQVFRIDRIVGNSSSMRTARRTVAAAIASAADTTVVGPAGSPTEAVARTIHFSQYRPGTAPALLPVDCTVADAESLHGALRQLQAHRANDAAGRLLLLHADRMTPEFMFELAEFVSVPGFSLGMISTAEKSLLQLADAGQCNPALARHLSTIELRLPRLCDRLEDLPLLAQSIVEDFNAEGNHQLTGLQADAIEALCDYRWPGDVDQLTRVIYQACQNCGSARIAKADLPKSFFQALSAQQQTAPREPSIQLADFMREVEDEIIQHALTQAKGNKTRAAKMLGISRQRMIRWADNHSADGKPSLPDSDDDR